jgi:hypothetical protein
LFHTCYREGCNLARWFKYFNKILLKALCFIAENELFVLTGMFFFTNIIS